MFLYDTEHLGVIQRQSQPGFQNILRRVSTFPASSFFVSIISFQEEVQGGQAQLARTRKPAEITYAYSRLRKVIQNFAQVQLLDFDLAASDRFEQLRLQRIRIGTLDLRIASIAQVHGFTVLTRNVRDFRLVPGLNVEDWTQ